MSKEGQVADPTGLNGWVVGEGSTLFTRRRNASGEMKHGGLGERKVYFYSPIRGAV